MKSRLTLACVGAAAVVAAGGFVGTGAGAVAAPHQPQRRPPSVRRPRTILQRRPRSRSGAPRPGARSSRPARAGSSVSENFGNKFPGEAAVYMGIVHVAIYDAAVAINGGYQPYATTPAPRPTRPPRPRSRPRRTTRSSGLQPQLGANQTILDTDYARLPGRAPGRHGRRRTGSRSASRSPQAVLALRANDGPSATRRSPTSARRRPGPASGNPTRPAPVLGLRLPGMRPLALRSASQFRPDGPNAADQPRSTPTTSTRSRTSAASTARPGRPSRRPGAVLDRPRRPAVERRHAPPRRRPRARPRADRPDAGDGARRRRRRDDRLLRRQVPLLVLAPLPGHPAGGHRRQPRHRGRPDLAAARHDAELPRVPVGARLPQHRGRHAPWTPSSAPTRSRFTLDSRAPGSPDARTRTYDRLHDVVKDVDTARVLVGFHFRNSDQQGTSLGRKVGRYITDHYFQPLR